MRRKLLIALVLTAAMSASFYAGRRFERIVLTEQFVRVANQVVKIYENALANERMKNNFIRGHQIEKYDL